MKKPSIKLRIVDFLSNNKGEHDTRTIAAAISAGLDNTSRNLSELAREGTITKVRRGVYCANSETAVSAQPPPNDDLKQISEALRSADDNKNTIDKLMNLYDKHIERYAQWFEKSVDDDTDFQEQLQFIENFKGLTAIGDKLMKRWSLEHVGYDTNTRQAQEDAKAKTAEREKAALEDAPIEEQVNVIGSFDLDTKQLIDNFPTLESITKEEGEEIKV